MHFYSYKNGDILKQGKYGIYEPYGQKIKPDIIDLIIIPALMADKRGFRLGYGGGYYDKFFNTNNTSVTKVIFIPQELVIKELPIEPHDIKVDFLITQTQIYKI